VTVYSLQIGRGKEKTAEEEFTQSSQRKSAEYTEKSEEKSGKFVALGRKSPPFALIEEHPQVHLCGWANYKNPRRRRKAAPTRGEE
jgi:hypothetical protein